MAAGYTADKPGSQFGPCKGECKHIDCAQHRVDAALKCPYCRKRIGWKARVYAHGKYLVHAACHETAVEAGPGMF